MRVSYVILTCNRMDDLKRCLDSIVKQSYKDLETIVIDNNSSDGTPKLMENYKDVNYIQLDYNSGVCKGRNIGFRRATGDLIVVIDDDGELPYEDTTEQIVKGFEKHPQMGIMALKVLNPDEPDCRRVIPSRNKEIINYTSETPVAYFPGGGMAVRRKLLDEIGMFPEEYFYSMEELDMSYRLFKTQWEILYFPQIFVYHYESKVSRPSWRLFYYRYRNRIWMTYSFLPYRYLFVNLSIWGANSFIHSIRHGHAKPFLKGVWDGLKGIKDFRQRRKDMLLSPTEVRRIKELQGRLYF